MRISRVVTVSLMFVVPVLVVLYYPFESSAYHPNGPLEFLCLPKVGIPHAVVRNECTDSEIKLILAQGQISELEPKSGLKGPEGQEGPEGPQGFPGPEGPVGSEGPNGLNGQNGLSAYQLAQFDGPIDAWLESLVGPAGITGQRGEIGPEGPEGPLGLQGLRGETGALGQTGPAGMAGVNGSNGKSAFELSEFPGSITDWLASLVGPKGDPGTVGPAGATGLQGPQGEQGLQGPKGEAGPAGPKGDQGEVGPTGPRGATGSDGASAFELSGFPGTIEAWLESLVGAKGETGPTGPTGPMGPVGPAGLGFGNPSLGESCSVDNDLNPATPVLNGTLSWVESKHGGISYYSIACRVG